jgi:hypothetical protein
MALILSPANAVAARLAQMRKPHDTNSTFGACWIGNPGRVSKGLK